MYGNATEDDGAFRRAETQVREEKFSPFKVQVHDRVERGQQENEMGFASNAKEAANRQARDVLRSRLGTMTGGVAAAALNRPGGEPEFARIHARLMEANERAAQLREKLGQHADRLFGEEDCKPTEPLPEPRPGAIGTVEHLIDQLIVTLHLTEAQAERNCRLA